ncbi:MAG: NGG1p interacting factor NIF3 [Microcoleus sp. SIO2G3]|nr:NGG1p interacting factor NIF3 [Microcoleus sp. SIO2G3]
MLSLDELARFLNQFLAVHRFKDEQGGVYRDSSRPIHRIGLALEPWMQLDEWVGNEQLDALFLHRPWKLELERLESDVGVVSYHLAFDECLTLGFNLRLAVVLGMEGIEVLGQKEGRPIGMIGEVQPQSFASYCRYIDEVFGGQDKALPGGSEKVSRVAVVGAMTDILVREAASRGADVYVTGQLRQPAEEAVRETGIGVVAVGHRRCEEWGLQALAGVMRERWCGLEVILPPRL